MTPKFATRVAEFLQGTVMPRLTSDAFVEDDPLGALRRSVGAIGLVLDACESPIEQLVALGFVSRWFRRMREAEPRRTDDVFYVRGDTFFAVLPDGVGSYWWIRQQVAAGAYRLDFAVEQFTVVDELWSGSHRRIAIECDGHDFHDRTREQAERDKSRDRELAALGWTVLRFTGREIYRDPFAIVDGVERVMATLKTAEQSREATEVSLIADAIRESDRMLAFERDGHADIDALAKRVLGLKVGAGALAQQALDAARRASVVIDSKTQTRQTGSDAKKTSKVYYAIVRGLLERSRGTR